MFAIKTSKELPIVSNNVIISDNHFTTGMTKLELIINDKPVLFNCFYDGVLTVYSGFIQDSQCTINNYCNIIINEERIRCKIMSITCAIFKEEIINKTINFTSNEVIDCGKMMLLNRVIISKID